MRTDEPYRFYGIFFDKFTYIILRRSVDCSRRIKYLRYVEVPGDTNSVVSYLGEEEIMGDVI